jgi:hypothetical protein
LAPFFGLNQPPITASDKDYDIESPFEMIHAQLEIVLRKAKEILVTLGFYLIVYVGLGIVCMW